jgi:hypothetical protein
VVVGSLPATTARPSLKGLVLSIPDSWSGFLGSLAANDKWLGEQYPIVPGELTMFDYESMIGLCSVHRADMGLSATSEESGQADGHDVLLKIHLADILKFVVRSGGKEDPRIASLDALEQKPAVPGVIRSWYDVVVDTLEKIEVAPRTKLQLMIFDGYDRPDGLHGHNWFQWFAVVAR